jgi:predicted phosphodiesterase
MKCLVLSDIHANWPALQAVLDAEHDADQILCLGDLVNYGPHPAECVSWAMSLNPPNRFIQGNHDRDFGWGNEPHCSPENRRFAQAMATATSSFLTVEMKRFLAQLKPSQEFRLGATLCFACHITAKGPLSAPFQHQNPQWEWESDIILVGPPEKPFTFVGHPGLLFLSHGHTPIKTRWGTTLVINPGSVGLPTDGDPRAAYALWEEGEVTFHRLAYEIEKTARAYIALCLEEQIKQELVAGLRTGRCLSARQVAEVTAEK